MNEAFAYKDIYLVPKYSELKSRSEADVSVTFGKHTFKNPVMPANMVAAIDEKHAKWLSENGYFYVMHRFFPKKINAYGGDETQTPFGFCHKAQEEKWKTISISIGVQKRDFITVENLAGWFGPIGREDPTRVDYITIDIAHGHCAVMKKMIEHIHQCFQHRFPNEPARPFIIAGNVATPEAVRDLTLWGADAVKVGIGGGGACSTKNKTGFHVPMFSCIKECVSKGGPIIQRRDFSGNRAETSPATVPIIADGGVRENADIAKALVAGATMVMAGSLFSECIDSPAETIERFYLDSYRTGAPDEYENIELQDGTKVSKFFRKKIFKKYFGSASALNKGEAKHVEGFEVELPCNGMTIERKIQEINEDLASAISYAGGKDLKALASVECVKV